MENSTDDADYTRKLLLESAEKAFSELCFKDAVDNAEAGIWPEALWGCLEELGFFTAAIPEEQGGTGLELVDLMATVRVAGRYAAPIPFGETIIGSWLLARAGLAVPAGPVTLGPVTPRQQFKLSRDSHGWVLDGTVRCIPWANLASRLVLNVETDEGQLVASVDTHLARQVGKSNLAGEPRGHLIFDQISLHDDDVRTIPSDCQLNSTLVYGAMLRGLQMAGALRTACDITVRYAGDRIAFGKPLNKLPAVQQNLALLAGQAAAANVAADMMLDAMARDVTDISAPVALARVRINEAVEIGARLAHQVHGAIGFTYEHMLHHLTRRLWSWRDEFGNDVYWSDWIGRQLIEGGEKQYWHTITEVAQL